MKRTIGLCFLIASMLWAAGPTPNAKGVALSRKGNSVLSVLPQKSVVATRNSLVKAVVPTKSISGAKRSVLKTVVSTSSVAVTQKTVVSTQVTLKKSVQPAKKSAKISEAKSATEAPKTGLEPQTQAGSKLLSEVDHLTPKQAFLFQAKLNAKMSNSVEESWYTEMGISSGLFYAIPSLKNFNATFGSTFGNVTGMPGVHVGVKYPLGKDMKYGVEFIVANSSLSKKTSSTVYESLMVGYYGAIAELDYAVIHSPDFVLDTIAGLGWMTGSYQYDRVDESGTGSSLNKLRTGSTLITRIGAQAKWRVSPLWESGVGLYYTMGKISDLSRAGVVDSTAPELDFTGLEFRVLNTLNF